MLSVSGELIYHTGKEILRGVIGVTCQMVGSSFLTAGTIYGINKLTSVCIRIFEYLSVKLRIRTISSIEEEKYYLAQFLYDDLLRFGKLFCLILAGLMLKILGENLNNE